MNGKLSIRHPQCLLQHENDHRRHLWHGFIEADGIAAELLPCPTFENFFTLARIKNLPIVTNYIDIRVK
jgi:hypothetical protein